MNNLHVNFELSRAFYFLLRVERCHAKIFGWTKTAVQGDVQLMNK